MPDQGYSKARFLPILWLAIVAGCVRPATGAVEPWAFPSSSQEAALQSGSKATTTPFMPAARDTEQVYDTPTPNPPVELPPLREDADVYIVQPGDSLMAIAELYGVTVQQIIDANDLLNPDILEAGQALLVPAPKPLGAGPDSKLIPDSEHVYGPTAVDFDTREFVKKAGGYLDAYEEAVDGPVMSGADIVRKIAREYSVHPRLLLAVLEYQSGWLINQTPAERDYPLGWVDSSRVGLYRQLMWAADMLNRGYYLWKAGGLAAYTLADGSIIPPDPTINAGTAGLQYLFSRLYGLEAWEAAVGPEGFQAVYRSLFGYPFEYAVEPLLPASLEPPAFQLPFERRVVWYFTGGPHGGWGDGSAWAALDFAPPGDALGCVQSNAWVVAAADGLIVRTGDGQVLQDLDSDGNEGTGWVILYMHIESRGRVKEGEQVQAGDRIGHPSCEGGYSTGTHLHIARKYNGEWIPADQAETAFVMDGWTATGAGYYYNGWLVRGDRSVIAENGRSEANEISR